MMQHNGSSEIDPLFPWVFVLLLINIAYHSSTIFVVESDSPVSTALRLVPTRFQLRSRGGVCVYVDFSYLFLSEMIMHLYSRRFTATTGEKMDVGGE